ncbi:MAG: LysM peptidoglycan-binding domain-containing protein, partial [Gammaproteobacteria bacterium]|nr:LysM peptidoglycan-binding domain-containing protein [Gammaproteobacteria bacterium]
SMVHDRIDQEMFDYLSRLDQLQTITQRAEPYLFFIVEQLRERGMPMELALLPIIESAYQPQATSRSEAAGLWQFIPSTGQHFGLKQNWWYDGRRDVHASTQAALDYLQRLHDMFGGDWPLALAAYNAGEGTVSRAIERAASKGKPTDYWSLDLPEETKAYVPRLIALSRLFRDPHVYGLIPHKIEDAPFLARIEFDRPLDLSKVANAMDMSVDELYRLNPGFKRGVNGNGKETVALLLPQDKAHRLKTLDIKDLYAVLPKQRQIKAARDESTVSFARRLGVSLATLRDMNPGLRDKVTRGQTVLLPESPSAHIELAEAKTTASAAPGKAIHHVVSPGENLYQISRQHGVDTQTLASWNGLKPNSTLKAGQKLVIYTEPSGKGSSPPRIPLVAHKTHLPETTGGSRKTKSAEGRSTSTPRATAKAPTGEVRKTTYTVQKGDTLFSIAKRFKVEVAQLRQWNKLDKKGELKPGQTIVVVLAEAPPKAS